MSPRPPRPDLLPRCLAATLLLGLAGCRSQPPPAPPDGSPTERREPPGKEIGIDVGWDELSKLMIYSPDPPAEELAQAKAVQQKKPGRVVITLCISPVGKTMAIRVKEGFDGDPEMDRICRDTVARLRFRPVMRDGKAVTACTQRAYNFMFN